MSYHIAYNKQRVMTIGWILLGPCFWYVLLDKTGKVRDWIRASDWKEARAKFAAYRKNGIPSGYRVERRGKVEDAA